MNPPGLPPGFGFHPEPDGFPGLLLGLAPPARGLPLLVVNGLARPPSLRNGRGDSLRPPPSLPELARPKLARPDPAPPLGRPVPLRPPSLRGVNGRGLNCRGPPLRSGLEPSYLEPAGLAPSCRSVCSTGSMRSREGFRGSKSRIGSGASRAAAGLGENARLNGGRPLPPVSRPKLPEGRSPGFFHAGFAPDVPPLPAALSPKPLPAGRWLKSPPRGLSPKDPLLGFSPKMRPAGGLPANGLPNAGFALNVRASAGLAPNELPPNESLRRCAPPLVPSLDGLPPALPAPLAASPLYPAPKRCGGRAPELCAARSSRLQAGLAPALCPGLSPPRPNAGFRVPNGLRSGAPLPNDSRFSNGFASKGLPSPTPVENGLGPPGLRCGLASPNDFLPPSFFHAPGFPPRARIAGFSGGSESSNFTLTGDLFFPALKVPSAAFRSRVSSCSSSSRSFPGS